MTDKSRTQFGPLGKQRGFTLIELIIVIVILGILAAVAIPKYQNIKGEATKAAAEGVYGAVQGAAAVGFSARVVSPSMGTAITNASSLVSALDGGVPQGWAASGLTLTNTGTSYNIRVATAESVGTSKAVLRKSW